LVLLWLAVLALLVLLIALSAQAQTNVQEEYRRQGNYVFDEIQGRIFYV